jgi:hypothetical protein
MSWPGSEAQIEDVKDSHKMHKSPKAKIMFSITIKN